MKMLNNFKRPVLKKQDVLSDLLNDAPGEMSGLGEPSGVTELPTDDLIDFNGHPFYVNDDEALEDLVQSIKAHGVLTPVLVRPIGDASGKGNAKAKYEKLAGHRRTLAAKIAGLVTVPTRILHNLSDEDAMAVVVETNLMQRSFADMRHSEKAAVIALHHSKLFSQGKRNDILRQLAVLEGDEYDGNGSANSGKASNDEITKNSDKRIAQMYSLSARTVSRYLRISKLNPELKKMLDDGQIDFLPAVTLSFLTENEQEMVAHYCITAGISGCRIDAKKADLLRELSKTGGLGTKTGLMVLRGDFAHKKPRPATIKINSGLYGRYFTSEQSPKEVANIVERALEMYFRNPDNGHNLDLEENNHETI